MKHGLRVRIVPLDLPGEIGVILGMKGAGILSEPMGAPHVAHISEHVLFHSMGSKYERREESPIAKLVDQWFAEGRANAETLPELMYFDIYPKSSDLVTALTVQIARGLGTVDTRVLEREKPIALSEVTGLEASRTAQIDPLVKFAWCPFTQAAMHGLNDVPLHEFTSYLTPDSIRAFCLSTRFRLDRAMLVVFGDVDPLIVEDELGAALDKMTIVLRSDPLPNQPINPGAVKATWDVASHQFFMAWPAPPPSDPAHPALSLLAQLLQQRLGFSPAISKLKRQPLLVYSDLSGLFVIQSPLKSKDDGDAFAVEVRKAIDALAADEGALGALKNARANLRASAGILTGPMQYPPALPRKIIAHTNVEIARMRAAFAWDQSPEDYGARADKVTGPEIKAAMKTWLAPEKAAIVTIVGKE